MGVIDSFLKMMCTIEIYVRYKKSTYKINIVDGIFIVSQQLWLLSRRVLRFLKRVVYRSTNIIVVILCATLFGMLLLPIGLLREEYKNWYDVLWDLRTFFLTSIFVVLVSTNINDEKARKDALHKQLDVYSTFIFNTEEYIKNLLSLMGISHSEDIFLTDGYMDIFYERLSEIKSHKSFTKEESIELISINKEYQFDLNNILQFLNSSDKLEMNKDSAREWILKGINVIRKEVLIIESLSESYSHKDLIEFINESMTYQQYIIAELRRPWRWDHNRNMQIRSRLVSRGKHIKGFFDTNEYWF